MRSLQSFGPVISVLAATAALLLSEAAAGAPNLPMPTGEYSVARRAFLWVDGDRAEILSPHANENREVGVWAWYPAAPQASDGAAPYVEDLEALSATLRDAEVSLLQSVLTHSASAADLVPEPARLPVILLSPGLATLPALYTTFAEELASHGYFVAVLDHPYDSVATLLSDGRVVRQAPQPDGDGELLAYMSERTTVRVQDIGFVIRLLNDLHEGSLDSPFRGRLDLARIGVLGHSIGGMAAAKACATYERVRACANMDGVVNALPAYPDTDGRGPSKPFMFMSKPFPAVPGESLEESERRLSLLHARGNAVLDDVEFGRSYRITIAGATHATFSDEEFLLAAEEEGPRELLGLVRAHLLAFFDEALRGLNPSILEGSPTDAALRIESFVPR